MRPSTLALAVTLAATAAGAQEAGEVRDLEFPTRELLLRIEDLAGRVQSLQVRETATETRIELPADILFDFDKSDIRPEAAAALKQAAELIRQGAKGTIRIEGHTDAKGGPAYNSKLSQRRAASVAKWLVDTEAVNARFASNGFGAQRPV